MLWGRTKMCLDKKRLLYRWTKDKNEQHSLLNILSDSFSHRIEGTEIRVWTAENTFVWIAVAKMCSLLAIRNSLSLSTLSSLSCFRSLCWQQHWQELLLWEMMGRVLPDPLVRSEVSYNCTRAVLCLSTLEPTHIHVHHHTHTHTCLTHTCLTPHCLSTSHGLTLFLFLSLDWGLFTCRCQCDCLQRGGKAWPFLSHSFCVPPCTLSLHLSCSTEEHRGKLPDKGGKHSAHASKLW